MGDGISLWLSELLLSHKSCDIWQLAYFMSIRKYLILCPVNRCIESDTSEEIANQLFSEEYKASTGMS